MIADCTLSPVAGPDWPDRLALTVRDRLLESRVLVHLLRLGNRKRQRGSVKPRPTWPGPIDQPSRRDELRIRNHAARLAEFLARDYGMVSPAQKRLAAELAVEVAQRIAEELSAPARGS
jgi:hypothetical protein